MSHPALFLIDALIGAAAVTLSTSTRGGKQVVVQADSYAARVPESARQLGPGKGESADQHRTGSSDSGGMLHVANSTALRLIHQNRRHHGGALAAASPCGVEDAVCHEVPAAPLEIHMDPGTAPHSDCYDPSTPARNPSWPAASRAQPAVGQARARRDF